MSELIVGIDLGTTNSEVAAFVDGQVRVLGPGDQRILPSCVGFSASGELLVGEPARNQQALYPERTVRSIKRRMGSQETVMLGSRSFTPPEISAVILRELAEWAGLSLGQHPAKAVITVPAYFSDAQRSATREAGALAGLDVVRILNEPTAASLAYGYGDGSRHTALIYDLGGGTFDVSVVTVEGDITEVLASHGNNRLGGDDFDDLLADRLAKEFQKQHGVALTENHAEAKARLWWAAEEAKKKLSQEPYAVIREEALITRAGKPLHLEMEISRSDYESLIRPLVESTLDSVSKALQDSSRKPSDMDAVLLVGGSTRTPLVFNLLSEMMATEPRQDVHPDLCVALGAGVLASRLAGQEVNRVLVDVSPYSFGVSYLGERGGVPYPHCYKPIIRRNTPLPLTRTELFATSHPYQTEVDIEVYQGDDDDALKDIPVGNFRVEGLTEMEDANEILCRMRLDLDGILEVAAVEKRTGKSKQITIANALEAKTPEEIAAGRKRIQEMFKSRAGRLPDYFEKPIEIDRDAFETEPIEVVPERASLPGEQEAEDLVERSRKLLDRMHADDREDAIGLHEKIGAAIESGDASALAEASRSLREMLFFMEGKPN
ncbi:MAG TPA: Hsp70 family protein [Bryobacteraceae bacterium]|jgi:molecular chaperone DnaK (HSP70)|nr:Hsp70 family protein [Bryobacteraceae bacterium]